MGIKIWVDDVRPAPKGYYWCCNVQGATAFIKSVYQFGDTVEIIDLDHDAGRYVCEGGDYIEILKWLEKEFNDDNLDKQCGQWDWHDGLKNNPPKFHIHSMNPVGVHNMRAIIERNGWKEV